jgi:small subunit ribosomal protein S11e
MRYYKSIGLGFKTPKEAIEGAYVDKKCPFTGNVSIRGRILKAMVISHKMKRTIVVRRDYLQYVRKYRRFEKRHRNMSVHCSPCFQNVREGDVVTVGQCRPLAKTVRFNVLEHQPSVNMVGTLCHTLLSVTPIVLSGFLIFSNLFVFSFFLYSKLAVNEREEGVSRLLNICIYFLFE